MFIVCIFLAVHSPEPGSAGGQCDDGARGERGQGDGAGPLGPGLSRRPRHEGGHQEGATRLPRPLRLAPEDAD